MAKKPLGAQALQEKARVVAALVLAEAERFGEHQAEIAEILFNKKWESH